MAKNEQKDEKKTARLEMAKDVSEPPSPTSNKNNEDPPQTRVTLCDGMAIKEACLDIAQSQDTKKPKDSKRRSRQRPQQEQDSDDEDLEGQPGAYCVQGSVATATAATTVSSLTNSVANERNPTTRMASELMLTAELARDPDEVVAEAMQQEQIRRQEAIEEAIRRERELQEAKIIHANQVEIVKDEDNASEEKFCGGRLSKCQFYLLMLLILLLVAGATTGVALALSEPEPPVVDDDDDDSGNSMGTLPPVKTPDPKVSTDEPTAAPKEWTQLGSDLVGGRHFGTSLAMSSNGRRMSVGGWDGDVTSPTMGWYEIGDDGTFTSLFSDDDWYYHYVEESDDTWYNQSKFWSTMSRDGSIFVVVAHDRSSWSSVPTSEVRFFGRLGSAVEEYDPLYVQGAHWWFGSNADLSSDGRMVAVGTYINGTGTGNVEVYNFTNEGWERVGNVLEEINAEGQFGELVRLSADGNRVAVSDGHNARVYESPAPGGTNQDWTQLGLDVDMDVGFVQGLSMSADGSTIAVSGSGVTVYSYRSDEDRWLPVGEPIVADTDNQRYNLDRAILSEDGKTVVTSTRNADSADLRDQVIGYTRIYRNVNGTYWHSDTESDRINGAKSTEAFGYELATNFDASRIAVAAPGNQEFYGFLPGLVRIYELEQY